MFNKAYKSIGMLGVIRQIKECYSKLKYGGDIEPLAFCFGMDYTAFNIDEAMSEKLGMKQNVYTRRANMMERAQTGLKKFGYDADGRDRQISAWIKRVEQWLKE
jgi:hypothetical protein